MAFPPTVITVRGYHLDIYQHVNNARYLEFLEEARWALFQQANLLERFAAQGLAFIIVRMEIDYRHAACMNDVLEITTMPGEFSSRSGVVYQKITNQKTGQTVVNAKLTYVVFDTKTQKTLHITDDIKALLGVFSNA